MKKLPQLWLWSLELKMDQNRSVKSVWTSVKLPIYWKYIMLLSWKLWTKDIFQGPQVFFWQNFFLRFCKQIFYRYSALLSFTVKQRKIALTEAPEIFRYRSNLLELHRFLGDKIKVFEFDYGKSNLINKQAVTSGWQNFLQWVVCSLYFLSVPTPPPLPIFCPCPSSCAFTSPPISVNWLRTNKRGKN